MDPFTSFFSASFIFFALALFAITFVIRTIVEYFWKGAKTSPPWNGLVLPLLPIVLGAIAGFFIKMYPDPLGASLSAREVFSVAAGLLSGLVYKLIKGYVKNQISLGTTTTTTTTPSTVTSTTEKNEGEAGKTMSSDIHPTL